MELRGITQFGAENRGKPAFSGHRRNFLFSMRRIIGGGFRASLQFLFAKLAFSERRISISERRFLRSICRAKFPFSERGILEGLTKGLHDVNKSYYYPKLSLLFLKQGFVAVTYDNRDQTVP